MMNNEINLTNCSGSCNDEKKGSCCSEKYKNVEPLPESSRPRRDGPGGENAK